MLMAQIKVQYTLHEDDPVRLFQYIFSYENSGNYALFNFHNQYTEELRSFDFIVKQYDKDNLLLVKNKMEYNNFTANANSFFVPKLKLVIDDKCDRIEVEVVEALFEQSYYFEGEMKEPVVEIEEEQFDSSKLHYFHSTKKLLFQKPLTTFLITILFTIVSFLVLYLWILN